MTLTHNFQIKALSKSEDERNSDGGPRIFSLHKYVRTHFCTLADPLLIMLCTN
jgi:hypothetical protein